jgi:putative hydrolase of the HAD superfamily
LKIEKTGIGKYFQTIVISEIVGVNKPDKAIFEHALSGARAVKEKSVMIGDSLEADIRGALDFGMTAIYFNPMQKEVPGYVNHHVHSLNQLTQWL